ncbi:MAG TPA: hypothetical protein VLI71_04330 [Gammaproteobacteria bacterium]|nr:hypothetical protein [Gammaproteobacteria bacterium]
MTQQSAGGMWVAGMGAGPATTLMIAEPGDLKISVAPTATSGPAFGYGAVTVVGNRVEGSLETRAIPSGPIGSAGAELHCTVSGTVSTRVSLQLTTLCTDRAGATTTTPISFLYDPRYETDSSLADIGGNYNFSANSPLNTAANSLNINGDGTLFGMYDNGPRCTLNGTVSIIHADFNLYRFEVRFSSCTRLVQYEGVTMTGLATRNLPGQKPGAFLLLMTAVVNGRLEFASVLYEPV